MTPICSRPIGALACAMMLAVIPARAHSADCPASIFYIFNVPYPSVVPARDTTVDQRGQHISGGYNLSNGTLGASAMNTEMETRTEDEFTLDGLPSGTEVGVLATLHAVGGAGPFYPGGSGYAYVSIGDGVLLDYVSESSFDRKLVIALHLTAGQPFHVICRAVCSGSNGAGQASGALAFEDVPAGATIASCQGFVADGPVPVRTTTWGALKLRYH